jgi:hypothetical protein
MFVRVSGSIVASVALALSCFGLSVSAGDASFKTKYFTLKLGGGKVTGMIANATGKDYLAKGVPAPILQVRLFKDNGVEKNYAPSGMTWSKPGKEFVLNYADIGVKVKVGVKAKKTHVVLKVLDVSPKDTVELVLWGPYPTTIKRTIGECVGVVYDKRFALGIQGLNIKTLGGYPRDRKLQDKLLVTSIKDENVYDEFCEDAVVRDEQRVWGNTAWRTSYGSVLQAFCRDRTKPWKISPGYTAAVFPDCGLNGSAVALFGCPAKRSTIVGFLGAIEKSENLPHPVLADGEWHKTAEDTKAIFLVAGVAEKVGDYIAWAKDTPVKLIYWDTPGPFADYGAFKHFYIGDAKYDEFTRKVKDGGFWNATLSLSNLLNANSPYVKNGDPRLVSAGLCDLAAPVDASATEITIKNPTPEIFKIDGSYSGIRIDRELVTYTSVTKSAPYKLRGCKRGAFNSKASSHQAGAKGHKMVLNPIRGNADLDAEIAKNIAAYHYKYDIRASAHDGIEFLEPEGHGEYSKLRFFDIWYHAFPKDRKYRPIMAASNANHFMWHYVGRYEWGDEGGSFNLRSGNKKYRNMNQNFYWRNFLPAFMGQVVITDKTTLDEAEWFFAIAAGCNAGYRVKLGTDPAILLKSAENAKIRKAMRAWETARRAHVFPLALRKYLQNNVAEFHLEALGNGKWKLYPRPDPKDRTKLGKPIVLPLSKPLTKEELARFAPPHIKKYKVTATKEQPGHPASAIVDGLINLASYWAASPYPQSVTIDLDGEETLHGIHLWPFFSSGRYFQYTVEVSKDGKTWTRVVDMSKNTKTPTTEGAKFTFDKPVKCNYIRVNMLYHNQNKGVYLVEVKWF